MDGTGAHEFVAETAGEARRRQLLGVYLPAPRWRVRVATFEGDVADRAEEWQVFVTATGEVRTVRHTLPEGRPGASLTEDEARRLAVAAIADRVGIECGARRRERDLGASREAESANGLDLHVSRQDRRGAAEGRAAGRGRDRGRRSGGGRALRVCPGRLAATGARGGHARHDSADPHRPRVRRRAGRRGHHRRDGVEPAAVHAAVVRRRRGTDAARVDRRGRQQLADAAGRVADRRAVAPGGRRRRRASVWSA